MARWRPTESRFGTPRDRRGLLYVVGQARRDTARSALVTAFDATSGNGQWHWESERITLPENPEWEPFHFLSPPAIADGTLYLVATTDVGLDRAAGRVWPTEWALLAIETGAGTVEWHEPISHAVDETVVAGNRLYLAGDDGRLTVLH